MALELVQLDSETLPGIADAIREKTGGTALLLPSEMKPAILAIPTGAALPDLTAPAEVGHVVAGKEYIDGNGNKRAGTLVVADSLFVAEVYLEDIGVGAAVTVESSVDGSTKDLTLPEPNLMPENIKSGVMIYGCTGNAKILRVETGTITPAEDSDTMTIEISGSPKAVSVVAAQTHTPAQGDILGACYDVLPWRTVCGYNGAILYYARGSSRLTQVNVSMDAAGIAFPAISSAFHWRADVEYQWTAYYWEDDA